MNLKGTLPVLILQLLARRAMHGYAISQEIKRCSKEVLDFREGTLYPTLHGLESRGWVAAFEEVDQGRMRRCYRITEEGLAALERERQHWQAWSRAVNTILESP